MSGVPTGILGGAIFGAIPYGGEAIPPATATSDTVPLSDSVTWTGTIAPQPSLYKLIPGIGSKGHSRVKRPVNAPRYFSELKILKGAGPTSYSLSASDTIPLSDSLARTGYSGHFTATDTSLSSDTATQNVRLPRTTSDTSLSSDANTRLVDHPYLGNDTSLSSDVANRQLFLPRTTSDTSLSSDSDSQHISVSRTASDTIPLSDSVAFSPGYSRSASDTISISDLLDISTQPAHGTDSITLNDTARGISSHAYVSDTIPLSDSATGTTGHNSRSASDTIPISDIENAVYFRSTSDSIPISDSASAITFFAGYDTIPLSDSASAAAAYDRAFVYQYGTELAVQPVPSAYVYQFGTELAFTPAAEAVLYQYGIEVAREGILYGQLWPIGQDPGGITRPASGQLWPRIDRIAQ